VYNTEVLDPAKIATISDVQFATLKDTVASRNGEWRTLSCDLSSLTCGALLLAESLELVGMLQDWMIGETNKFSVELVLKVPISKIE
jgi:hypothetical protein